MKIEDAGGSHRQHSRSNPSLLPPLPSVPEFVSIPAKGSRVRPGKSSSVLTSPGQSNLFQEKKDCLFFLSPPFALRSSISLRSMKTKQTNPKSKSTSGSRKSTVDLDCELLIWGKNGLPTSALPACRSPFRPLMTRKSHRTNQMQTETNQKINVSTLDLGCEENARPMEKTATAQI
jgi:hypothetical protein